MTNQEYKEKRNKMIQYQALGAAQLVFIVTLFSFGLLLLLQEIDDLITSIVLKVLGFILIRMAYNIYNKLRNK